MFAVKQMGGAFNFVVTMHNHGVYMVPAGSIYIFHLCTNDNSSIPGLLASFLLLWCFEGICVAVTSTGMLDPLMMNNFKYLVYNRR